MGTLRCLIADDDKVGRELLAHQLEEVAECVLANDGKDAVEKYQCAADEGVPFDFIILDVMMPELDGNAAGKAIRRIERAQGVPLNKQVKIIVLTAQNTPADVMESFMSVQPAAHLIKPVDPNLLKTTLKRVGIKS